MFETISAFSAGLNIFHHPSSIFHLYPILPKHILIRRQDDELSFCHCDDVMQFYIIKYMALFTDSQTVTQKPYKTCP